MGSLSSESFASKFLSSAHSSRRLLCPNISIYRRATFWCRNLAVVLRLDPRQFQCQLVVSDADIGLASNLGHTFLVPPGAAGAGPMCNSWSPGTRLSDAVYPTNPLGGRVPRLGNLQEHEVRAPLLEVHGGCTEKKVHNKHGSPRSAAVPVLCAKQTFLQDSLKTPSFSDCDMLSYFWYSRYPS